MDSHAHPADLVREREVEDLQPGGHHCHVFETGEQSLAVLVPFLAAGLKAGDRCVASLTETPIDDVREALEDRGIDTQARIEEGDLILRPAQEGYGDPGSFDVEGRVEDLATMARQAREEGYENLRSAGEMNWAAASLDHETLTRYEAELNRFLASEAGEHVIGLCQYHLSAFEPELAADVLRAHPLTIHGTRVSENLFYQPPEVLLADDPQAEVDHILDRLTSEPEREEAIREGLEELEELEARNQRLTRFQEITSQEIDGTLQALKAHLKRLENDLATPWPEMAATSIEFALEGTGRIEETLEALIEYGRLETEELDRSTVDGGGALDQARSELEAQLERAGIEVTHDTLPSVEADREELVLVFEQLLANALQRAGPGASRVHVGVEETAETWRFSLEDDGQQLSPEERERISEVLERGPGAGSAAEIGLGLAICGRIVDRHGGRMSLESSSRGGTRFSFTIAKPTDPGTDAGAPRDEAESA